MPKSCGACGSPLDPAAVAANLWRCPACGDHRPMPARARLELLADPGSLGAVDQEIVGGDPLKFVDSRPYPERLLEARADAGETEAFIAAPATSGGVPVLVGAMDFAFMGGSMSSAVGERVARVFERAANEKRAVVIATASGGARMQEGTLSLFQMTKTAAAIARFRRGRTPYLALLCHPTLGGVAASFGTLADVLLAEPRARIGFAGPRVIEQLLGRPLAPGFQRAEFLFEHGLIDRIVPRDRQREEIARLVGLLSGGSGHAA